MNRPTQQPIPLSNLLLDIDNPRFAHTLQGQLEALTKIVIEQKDDLVRLGEDIIRHGLNPNDLMMVTASKTDPNFFVVHEGNRRLAALKLMAEASLIDSLFIPDEIKRKFRRLADKYREASIHQVLCVVYEDYQQTRHWIELKHTGKNEGVGVDPWVAFMKRRFEGNLSAGSQAVNLVRESTKLSIDEKKLLDNPGEYESTLNRVLGSPAARKLLGVDLVKKQLMPSEDASHAMDNLKRLVLAFAEGKYNTNHVYRRPDLINTVTEIVGKTTDVTPSTTTSHRNLSKTSINIGNLSRERKTVAPPKKKLPIDIPRVQDIYKELQTIDVTQCPNAAGILIRVFVEQSIDAYARHHGINLKVQGKPGHQVPDKEVTLEKKIQLVTNHLKNNGFPASDLKEIETAIHSPNNPISIHSLHAFVHNLSYSPKPSDLPIIWNNLSNFIDALWKPIK